jgi:hypothetical protein
MALLYLVGQTIYDVDKEKPVIYVDTITYEDDKVIREMVSIHDGNSLLNHDGFSLCHLFTTDVSILDRELYHGKYCDGLMYGGLDEDFVLKNKKGIKKYLLEVEEKIKNSEIFVKSLNKKKSK